jgi:hypothetical protein
MQRLLPFLSISAIIATAGVSALFGQTPVHRSRIEITLERQEGKVWKAVDPSLVLASGDVVRFRFKSNFDGYLYVTNYATSGKSSLLFPRDETGRNNRIEAGKEYVIPETQAFFRIAGPPGYEMVYWYISPVSLGERFDLTPHKPSNYRPPLLLPRCDDTAMRARGVCLDNEAGPRAVEQEKSLPGELAPMRDMSSRELTIVQQRNQSVVSPAGSALAPVFCEFRLAHK